MIYFIPYILLLMIFWDFTIHVIDKRDRKFFLSNQYTMMWREKMKNSKFFFSYYYPYFWGKKKLVSSDEQGWKRYDYFWLSYWGTATILLIFYLIFR